jgi:hypothetical protein
MSLNSRNSKLRSPSGSELEYELMTNLNKENEKLRNENHELKSKLDHIDNKFDKLSSENGDLKKYMKDKSENFDEMKKVLSMLYGEVTEMKKIRNSTPADKETIKTETQSNKGNKFEPSPFKKCDFIMDNIINTERSDQLIDGNCYTDSAIQPPEIPKLSIIPKGSVQTTQNNVSIIFIQNDGDSELDSRNRTGCFLKIDGDSNYNTNISQEYNLEEGLLNDNENKGIIFVYLVAMNSGTSTGPGSKNFNLPSRMGDFNDEFMEFYEEFSPSWRQECDRINLSKLVNNFKGKITSIKMFV